MVLTKDDIKQWMQANFHTRRWLASKCGVSIQTLANWFSKNGTIPETQMAAIAKLIQTNNIQKNQIIVEFDRPELEQITAKAYQENMLVQDWIEKLAIEHSRKTEE